MTAEPADHDGPAGRRRPQRLLISFLGALVLDQDLPPLNSRVFLRLLDDLGVTESAGRATLARMTAKGWLDRHQEGRTARYTLTPSGADTLRQGAVRVAAAAPFTRPGGDWTLLSYSMPESRRDLRHQIRARLTWAGFGGLRDGLWIAPGQVDVAHLLAEVVTDLDEVAEAFVARPAPGFDVGRLVHRAWDLAAIRDEHERFLALWETDDGPATGAHAMAALTALGSDWLQLLRTDPGLPVEHLTPDWPSVRSAATYRARYAALHPAAGEWLRRLIATESRRR